MAQGARRHPGRFERELASLVQKRLDGVCAAIFDDLDPIFQEDSLRHRSVLALTALAGAALLGAGCGSSSSSSASESSSPNNAAAQSASNPYSSGATTSAAAATTSATAISTTHTNLGTVLTAGPKHMTVYLFEADHGTTSSCSGACAQAWPPVTTSGAPKAQGGAQTAQLGTTKRSDGTEQVTYNGHPLYYYVSDQNSGETTGEGVNSFGAAWYVLDAKGNKVDNS